MLRGGMFDLPTFTFFREMNIWTGSYYRNDFNYKIIPIKSEEVKELKAVIWYGEKSFDNIAEEDYEAVLHTEFSDEGFHEIVSQIEGEAKKYISTHKLKPLKY